MDKLFNNLFIKEKEKNEKTHKLIQTYLENSNINEKEWNNYNKLSKLINNCINIENNISLINDDLKIMKNNIKLNKVNLVYNFYPEENDSLNNFLEIIKKFGCIYSNSFQFK